MSALAMALAAILTRHAQPSHPEHAELGTAGVLQITWLLGRKLDLRNVPESVKNGFDVANMLRTHANSAKIKELRKVGKGIDVRGWGYPEN
jgi:hypothetical protein